jgi:hypothetical protein
MTLQEQALEAVDRDLESAASLSPETLTAIRHRAFLSDEDGFMLIPSFWGDAALGRAMFEAIDIHQHGECPLQRWLREELATLAPVAERYFEWGEAQIRGEIRLECIGGKLGIDPDLCMTTRESDGYRILISHTYYHVLLVAARSCAARIWLASEEPRNTVKAKEINDSLRDVLRLYDGTRAAPKTDAITAKLLPHQILMVERLAKSFRRFVVAREMCRILLWNRGGKLHKTTIP